MDDARLEDMAEGPRYAESILQTHKPVHPGPGRTRCPVCEAWYPCDLVSLAARVSLDLAALEASRAECARLRVAIHECHTENAEGWGLNPPSMADCRMCAALNGSADATVGSETTDEPIPGSRQAFIKAMQERG